MEKSILKNKWCKTFLKGTLYTCSFLVSWKPSPFSTTINDKNYQLLYATTHFHNKQYETPSMIWLCKEVVSSFKHAVICILRWCCSVFRIKYKFVNCYIIWTDYFHLLYVKYLFSYLKLSERRFRLWIFVIVQFLDTFNKKKNHCNRYFNR